MSSKAPCNLRVKEGDEMAIIVGCAMGLTIVRSKGSSSGNCKLSCCRLGC